MSLDSRSVRDVRVRAAWPPVEVVERHETRRELATIALLMVVATAIYVAVPAIPAVLALAPAFVGGATGSAAFLSPHLGDGRGA